MAANKSGMTFNTKDFDIEFAKVCDKAIPKAAADQMHYRVAGMVLRDAVLEEPRAPHLTGNLWRSQKVEQPKILKGEVTI